MTINRQIDLIQLVLIASLLFLYSLFYVATLESGYFYILAGMLSYFVIVFFCFLTNSNFISPLRLASLAIFIGCLLRNFFLHYSDSDRVGFLLNYLPVNYYAGHSFWIVFGIFFLCLGYYFANFHKNSGVPNSRGVSNSVKRIFLNGRHRWLVFALGAGLGLIGTYLFVDQVGLQSISLSTISNKRPVELDSGEYTSLGHVRILYKFTEFCFYILFVSFLGARRKSKFLLIQILILFLISSLVPFLNSSRSEIVLMIINVFIISYIRKKIDIKKALIGIIFCVMIISFMGYLRALAQSEDNYVDDKQNPIESIVGAGNFLDMSRTIYIIKEFPDKDGYMLGESYFHWVTGFIPRVLWHDKPNVSLGPYIKSVVYGQDIRNHGYPPGFIAEAFINFSGFGVIFISAILGVIFRVLDSILKRAQNNDFLLLVYIAVAWRMSFGLIGLNFSQAFMQVFMNIMPLIVILYLLKKTGGFLHASKSYYIGVDEGRDNFASCRP